MNTMLNCLFDFELVNKSQIEILTEQPRVGFLSLRKKWSILKHETKLFDSVRGQNL